MKQFLATKINFSSACLKEIGLLKWQTHNYLENLLNEILKKRVNGVKRLSFETSLFLKFYDNFRVV